MFCLYRPSKVVRNLVSGTFIHYSSRNMGSGKTALVLLSEGSEEMEFTISADVLRRAGIAVTVAGIQGSNALTCSRQVKIVPDVAISEVVNNTYDVIVLPGGLGGANAFCESAEVGSLLKLHEKEGKIVAAICAAPTALKAHSVASGKQVTCYPSLRDKLESDEYKYINEKVVIDGNIITSQGPGTAFDFALALVQKLTNEETTKKVAQGLLLA